MSAKIQLGTPPGYPVRWEDVDSSQVGACNALWMRSMIGQHRGAVETGSAEIDNGVYVAAVRTAGNPPNTVTTPQGEIDQMTKVLGG